MSQPTGSIYEIRWSELFPWLILAKAWRVSLLMRVLAYAWLGLLLTQWGWSVCEGLAGNSPPQLERLAERSGRALMDVRELKASERRLAASSLFQVDQPTDTIEVDIEGLGDTTWWHHDWGRDGEGPLVKGWSWLSSPLVMIFDKDTTFISAFFKLLCGLWAIAVWALIGGIIARTAARYLTREEIIGPIDAGLAAVSKWPSTAGGPCLVLLFACLLTIPLAIVGVLIRSDMLAMLAGFFWIAGLLWGILLAVVLIALWFGWPLMWATIAVERSDAFDAAARTASYVYQRPLRLVFYVLIASVLGIFGQLIVSGFAASGSYLAEWAISWGSGNERIAQLTVDVIAPGVAPTREVNGTLAGHSIRFWKDMLSAVAAAYPLAYLFSSSVGIYLLLRLHVDSTEMDEIVVDEAEQMGRMPELRDSASGIPSLEDEEPKDLSTRRNIEPDDVQG